MWDESGIYKISERIALWYVDKNLVEYLKNVNREDLSVRLTEKEIAILMEN